MRDHRASIKNQMDINKLGPGDIIRQRTGGDGYIVSSESYGGRVTAVRVVDVTNPDEWVLVAKNHPNQSLNADPKSLGLIVRLFAWVSKFI